MLNETLSAACLIVFSAKYALTSHVVRHSFILNLQIFNCSVRVQSFIKFSEDTSVDFYDLIRSSNTRKWSDIIMKIRRCRFSSQFFLYLHRLDHYLAMFSMFYCCMKIVKLIFFHELWIFCRRRSFSLNLSGWHSIMVERGVVNQ